MADNTETSKLSWWQKILDRVCDWTDKHMPWWMEVLIVSILAILMLVVVGVAFLSFAAWADHDNKNIEISPAEFQIIGEWQQGGFVSQSEIDKCLDDNKITFNEFKYLQRVSSAAWKMKLKQ